MVLSLKSKMKKQLKNFISNIFHRFLSADLVWRFYKPFAEMNADIYLEKNREVSAKRDLKFFEQYSHLLSDVVSSGPFEGLIYPFRGALHSTLFPKLLGSYEFELHDVLDQVFERDYKTVVDIGCAEGYYAVGFAQKFKNSQIYAVDLNPDARDKTSLMAEANGIAQTDRFQVLEEASPEFLMTLDPAQTHFVFCDCEGYELELFSAEVLSHLWHSDILVELHDFLVPGVSDILMDRMEATHAVRVIKSVDDVFRHREMENPAIRSAPLADQISLLAEKRPCQMEWLFCEARN